MNGQCVRAVGTKKTCQATIQRWGLSSGNTEGIRLDDATAKHTVTAIEDGGLAWTQRTLGPVESYEDGSPNPRLQARTDRWGGIADLDVRVGLALHQGRLEDIEVRNGATGAKKLFIGTEHNGVGLGHHGLHIEAAPLLTPRPRRWPRV